MTDPTAEPPTTRPPRRSLLRRLAVVAAIGSVVAVIVAALGVWWAVTRTGEVPDFYETATIPEADSEERLREAVAVEAAARELFGRPLSVAELDPEHETLLAEAGIAAESDTLPPSPDDLDPLVPPAPSDADASAEMPSLRLTESQINAWLATRTFKTPPGAAKVEGARIKLGEEEFKFGVKVDSKNYDGVVSGDVAAALLSPTSLKLRLTALRLGTLPIPAAKLVRSFGLKPSRSFPGSMTLDGESLLLELDWSGRRDVPVRLAELSIAPDGVIVQPATE